MKRTMPHLAILVAASLVATAGSLAEANDASLSSFERVMVPPAPKPIADFELTDQDGRNFRFSSLRGAPALMIFGFVHCPDICPTSLERLRLLKQSNPELKKVPVVMISVDAERDSAAALKGYLQHFSGEFIGLTGDPQHIRQIAAQFSAAFFKGAVNTTSGEYTVSHSGQVYAIDKAGNLRAELYDASLEAMAGVTKALLAE
jgi:protein SCO1